MVETEMMILLNNAGSMTVTDYYSHAFVQPTQKTSTKLTLISSTSNSTGIFGNFSRALSPKDSLDTAISIGLSSDFSFAYLSTAGKGFSRHNMIGFGLITFGKLNSSSSYLPGGGLPLPYIELDQNFSIS